MTTIQSSNPSTTIGFKTSSTLHTKRHAATSITQNIPGTSNSNEARYWTEKLGIGKSQHTKTKNKFAHPRRVRLKTKGSSLVQQVIFGPPALSKTPTLAVVSGPRVGLYGTTPQSEFSRALARSSTSMLTNNMESVDPERQVQVGGNLAICGAFRSDGRLLAVGTDIGELRICDVTMRATLTTFTTASRLPVRCVSWLRNGQNLFTGSDDGVGRLWNIGVTNKSKSLLTLSGHGDAIRCATIWQKPAVETNDTNSWWTALAFTGSYDHTIRMWNIDMDSTDSASTEDRCLAVMDHGCPVEALVLMKSDIIDVPFWLLSAGGTSIKVWNPVSGACVSTVTTQHRKTITTLASVIRKDYDPDTKKASVARRILSSALDGTLQFHSWNAVDGSMSHLYCTKVVDAITAVAMDEEGNRIAVGTVSGTVLVHKRGPSIEQHKRSGDPLAGTYAFFQRGMNTSANAADYIVASQNKKRKLRNYDKALKQFRYTDALDDALATRNAKSVMLVLEELGKRRGLTISISNRDEESLEPILSFTIKYITKPHYAALLIGVANKLLDIYSDVGGQSETIDELFVKLRNQVCGEVREQKSLLKLIGQIETCVHNTES